MAVRNHGSGRSLEPDCEGEGAAVPRGTLEPDFAAHQFHQSGRDRESQAGAAVLASDAAVVLSERFEYEMVLLGRDTDARIGEDEQQLDMLFAARLALHA